MGRSPCCDKEHINKGAWTKEEDDRLISYIKRHGEGSWRSLPKAAGLLRCGKSCRLRWINYLRPDLKRGNFTDEEDELIIHLHSILGNKWSLIAARLPGRTDNEIKNYWNTHIRRKLLNRGIDPRTHQSVTTNSTATAGVITMVGDNHEGNNINRGIYINNVTTTTTTTHTSGGSTTNSSTNNDSAAKTNGAAGDDGAIRTMHMNTDCAVSMEESSSSFSNSNVIYPVESDLNLDLSIGLFPCSSPLTSSGNKVVDHHLFKEQQKNTITAVVSSSQDGGLCLCCRLGFPNGQPCDCKSTITNITLENPFRFYIS